MIKRTVLSVLLAINIPLCMNADNRLLQNNNFCTTILDKITHAGQFISDHKWAFLTLSAVAITSGALYLYNKKNKQDTKTSYYRILNENNYILIAFTRNPHQTKNTPVLKGTLQKKEPKKQKKEDTPSPYSIPIIHTDSRPGTYRTNNKSINEDFVVQNCIDNRWVLGFIMDGHFYNNSSTDRTLWAPNRFQDLFIKNLTTKLTKYKNQSDPGVSIIQQIAPKLESIVLDTEYSISYQLFYERIDNNTTCDDCTQQLLDSGFTLSGMLFDTYTQEAATFWVGDSPIIIKTDWQTELAKKSIKNRDLYIENKDTRTYYGIIGGTENSIPDDQKYSDYDDWNEYLNENKPNPKDVYKKLKHKSIFQCMFRKSLYHLLAKETFNNYPTIDKSITKENFNKKNCFKEYLQQFKNQNNIAIDFFENIKIRPYLCIPNPLTIKKFHYTIINNTNLKHVLWIALTTDGYIDRYADRDFIPKYIYGVNSDKYSFANILSKSCELFDSINDHASKEHASKESVEQIVNNNYKNTPPKRDDSSFIFINIRSIFEEQKKKKTAS